MREGDFLSWAYRGLYSYKKPRPHDVAALRRAQPFRLDRAASRVVGDLYYGDTNAEMARRLELACLPFETVWLEWDALGVWEAASSEVRDATDMSRVAPMKGVLLHRIHPERPTFWQARVFDDNGDPRGMAIEAPLGFVVDTEANIGFLPPFGEDIDKVELDSMILWSKTREEMPERLLHAGAMTQNAHFAHLWATPERKLENAPLMKQALESVEGLGGFLCAALAVINEVPITRRVYVPEGSFMGGGMKRRLLSNATVEINLRGRSVVRKVRKLLKAAHARHRAHPVRGHWRHYHRGTAQEQRVWIDEHIRGDPKLGWVDHKYEVMSHD